MASGQDAAERNPHPIVDFALHLLAKKQNGSYELAPAAAKKLEGALEELSTRPDYPRAVKDLAFLGYLLETKMKSKATARSVLNLCESVTASAMKKARNGSRQTP